MRKRLRFLLLRDLDHSFGDERTGDAGAKKILSLVNRAGLHHRKNKIPRKFFLKIVDVTFGSAGLLRFFFQALEFLLLPDVGAKSDDLGLIIFFEPPENN